MEQDIINDYRRRVSAANQEAEKFKKLANNYSLYRLVAFGIFILSVCVAIGVDEILIIAFSLAALIVCFSWLIKKQSKFDTLKNYYTDVERVNENELKSIETHGNMYDNGTMFGNDKYYYASDLDIFGSNSLVSID